MVEMAGFNCTFMELKYRPAYAQAVQRTQRTYQVQEGEDRALVRHTRTSRGDGNNQTLQGQGVASLSS